MVPSYLKHFNSRPHGGRPGHRNCKNRVAGHFNSRPHGGRQKQQYFNEYGKRFQLTPSRRATLQHCFWQVRSNVFQLTPSRRATSQTVIAGSCIIFQLTPSRRATQCSTHNRRELRYFNSRPHGGRRVLSVVLIVGELFQLTPSRRATSCHVSPVSTISFQLTPSRRATTSGTWPCFPSCISTHALTEGDIDRNICRCVYSISTHALTEGDGKFRQIFLLNRGYAYSISLYFLPHFISLLPQILSFQQKSFKFQVRIFLLFSVHLAFALQNQCVHHVKYRFCTNMFYFVFVLFTQIVKPQTIGLFIYDFF